MAALLLPPFALMDGAAALGEAPYAFANAEAETLVAAMTVAPARARRVLIDTFVGALKSAGVWSKMDVMWVLAAHDEQAGRLNWISPGSFTLTPVNAPTFTVDRGFNGDGSTSYLDTGWDPATNGVQSTQNSTSIWDYSRTTSGNNVYTFGTISADRLGVRNRTGTADEIRVNSTTALAGLAGGAMPQMIIGRRASSTTVSLVRDGIEHRTGSSTSSALSNVDLAFGRAGSGSPYGSAQKSIGAISSYLDDTECSAAYSACHDYMLAIGADT